MSIRLFQGVIYQMKDAFDRVIGVIDENGVVISCSDLGKMGDIRQGVREELSFSSEFMAIDGYTYRYMGVGQKSEYIVFVEGEDKMADKLSKLLSVALGNIKSLHDEKYDKGSFIKNIILDNILPSDIYIKSKELHFNTEELRIVFLIKFYGKTDMMPFEMLQNMFPDKSKDYVISVGEHDIVLVKELKPGTEMRDIEKIAVNIDDTLSTEIYTKVAAADTAATIEKYRKELESGERHVFDTSKFTVAITDAIKDRCTVDENGHLTSYKADVDTDAAFTPDTEVVSNGYFHESEKRSAPYFDVEIEGITLLNRNYGD